MNSNEITNPYASPESPHDPAIETRIQSLKWLRGAALGILFFAAFEFLSGLIWIIVAPIVFAATVFFPMKDQPPLWQTALGLTAAIAVTVRAGYMFYAALHLRSAKNYRWGKAAAILAVLGVVYPLLWFDVPFGIWAFILLRKQKYKQLFDN